MRKLFFYFGSLLSASLFSQDFFGLQSSNYAGVTGAISNPASIADSRYVVDITLVGFNLDINNNYIGIKRSALTYSGSIFNPSAIKFPNSWGNTDYKSETYFKNNFVVTNNGKSKELVANMRLALPSFMISLNSKNAIALNISFRNYLNVSGVSQDLADLVYSEFSISQLLNRRLVNKNLNFNQVSWVEYGLTYARVLKEDNHHFFKAGITPKLLQAIDAVYFHLHEAEFNLSTKDTFSFFNAKLDYGYSGNLDILSGSESEKPRFKPVYGWGVDLGGIYEWRPNYQSYKYDMNGKTDMWRRDKNKYKLRLGFALLDVGQIKFKKGQYSNSVEANVTRFNIAKFDKISDFESLDSVSKANFGVKSNSDFKILLPTALNLQADYNIWKPFYINLTTNITNIHKRSSHRAYEFSVISLAPRFEHKWFGLTLPLTFNRLSAQRGSFFAPGLMLRLGPLVVGTGNFMGFWRGDVYGAHMYMLLKIPIPYGHYRDKDGDGVSNRKDKCKKIPGVWEFKGCPDRDNDHISDDMDKCPDIAGLKELQGCPDKDGDGLADSNDACPDSAGTVEFNGCPDTDGDKIIDRRDACPQSAGLAEFNGCPDTDGDGTPDSEDICPTVFGPIEMKGCPDRDGDGLMDGEDDCPELAGPKEFKGCPDKDEDKVPDKDDNCAEVFGPVENKGCPWPDTDYDGIIDREDSCVITPGERRFKGCPPPIKATEKKILEKAFASLEFATGKDIIKPKSLPSLNDLAKLLIKHRLEWTLKLSGHTDNEGTPESNMILSEKRAKAVKNYLVKKGVLGAQLLIEWFGQTQPVADNKTQGGKQKNRRVEMKVIFKE